MLVGLSCGDSQSQARLTWTFKYRSSPSLTVWWRDTVHSTGSWGQPCACKQHSIPLHTNSVPMLDSESLTQAGVLVTCWFRASHLRRTSRHQQCLYLLVLLSGAELTVMQKPRADRVLQIQDLLSLNSGLLHGSNTTSSTGYKLQTTTDTTSSKGWLTITCPASDQRGPRMFLNWLQNELFTLGRFCVHFAKSQPEDKLRRNAVIHHALLPYQESIKTHKTQCWLRLLKIW